LYQPDRIAYPVLIKEIFNYGIDYSIIFSYHAVTKKNNKVLVHV
jgi:hypothetical protein